MKKCSACDKELRFLGKNDNFGIFRCPSCGLGVTSGIFPRTRYAVYHRDPVYIKEEKRFKNIFERRVNVILRFKKLGKALEAGSSTGVFLSLLKEKRWEVQGVEPSLAARVAEKNGILTLNTTFEKAELKDGTFDLVIFNHVLEHIENPVEILQKANQVLKKDGIVLIDAPNFASLSARISGRRWRYILPNEHRWHFTPKSLSFLLEKAGFKVIYWEAHSGIWGYGNPLEEIWQAFIGRKKRFFTDMLTAIPAFIFTQLRLGTGLTVVARKIEGG